jgi:coronin-1B/1C/6
MLTEPVYKNNVDTASGQFMLWYDEDTSMLFVAGKGDGNIRYYEFDQQAEKKELFELSQYKV